MITGGREEDTSISGEFTPHYKLPVREMPMRRTTYCRWVLPPAVLLVSIASQSGSHDISHRLHHHFEHYFLEMDLDRSGTLSLHELSRQAHKAQMGTQFSDRFLDEPTDWVQQDVLKSFLRADADADGELTPDELLKPGAMQSTTSHLILDHHWEFERPHPEHGKREL